MHMSIARRGRHAFTLIELIVVVAILGIVSLLAIPVFSGFREAVNAGVAFTNATEVARSASALHELGTFAPLATAATEAGVPLVNQAVVVGGWCSAINQDANGHYAAVAAVEGECSGQGPVTACTLLIDTLRVNVMQVWPNGLLADSEVLMSYYTPARVQCDSSEEWVTLYVTEYDPWLVTHTL